MEEVRCPSHRIELDGRGGSGSSNRIKGLLVVYIRR
jgi:hypothetical protein